MKVAANRMAPGLEYALAAVEDLFGDRLLGGQREQRAAVSSVAPASRKSLEVIMKRVFLAHDETADPHAERAFSSDVSKSWLDLTRTPSNEEHVTVNYAAKRTHGRLNWGRGQSELGRPVVNAG
ncbi:MAG: hypothetical protein ACXW3S_13545 [Rhodoplanes sp.]